MGLSSKQIAALPLVAAVVSPVLSSVGWLTQGAAIRYLSPEIYLTFSHLLSAVLLGLYLALRRELPSLSLFWSSRRPLLLLFLARYIGSPLIFTYALLLTDAAKVMFLTKVEPYMVVFWCWMLQGQKLGRYHLSLLAVHIAGAIVLSLGGTAEIGLDQLGDILVLIATALSALSYIPAHSLSASLGSIRVSFVCQSIAIPFFLFFGLATGGLVAGFQGEHTSAGVLQLIWSVLLVHISSHILWYFSLRDGRAWLISALRCLGPVFAAPIAWIFFSQPLTMVQIGGALVVLVTSVMMVRAREKVGPR